MMTINRCTDCVDFFLEHCGPGIEKGKFTFIPFILYTPSLFEMFIAKWLKIHLPDNLMITSQFVADLDENGMFFFQIDLLLKDALSGEVIGVIDTKYKKDAIPDSADIQQINCLCCQDEDKKGISYISIRHYKINLIISWRHSG
jgi:5-methylcytosine-specific restriction endonuclease McrBC regulatory subunit McrC